MDDAPFLPRRVGPGLWAWVDEHAGRRRLMLVVVGLGSSREDRANAARDWALSLLERHRGPDEVALVVAKEGAVVLEDWRVDAPGVVEEARRASQRLATPDVVGTKEGRR